jgi:Mg2+-importing ATPase
MASAPVLALTGTIMVVGIIIPYTGLGTRIGMQPLPGIYFAWLALTLASYCVLTQVVKTLYIRRYGRWL